MYTGLWGESDPFLMLFPLTLLVPMTKIPKPEMNEEEPW